MMFETGKGDFRLGEKWVAYCFLSFILAFLQEIIPHCILLHSK